MSELTSLAIVRRTNPAANEQDCSAGMSFDIPNELVYDGTAEGRVSLSRQLAALSPAWILVVDEREIVSCRELDALGVFLAEHALAGCAYGVQVPGNNAATEFSFRIFA